MTLVTKKLIYDVTIRSHRGFYLYIIVMADEINIIAHAIMTIIRITTQIHIIAIPKTNVAFVAIIVCGIP